MELINSIIPIVKEASALMKREGFSVKEKGSVEDIVTSSDLAVQEFLTGRLAGLLPGSGIICGLDGNFPSLQKPSLVIAANLQKSMERILDTVRRHLPSLPY